MVKLEYYNCVVERINPETPTRVITSYYGKDDLPFKVVWREAVYPEEEGGTMQYWIANGACVRARLIPREAT